MSGKEIGLVMPSSNNNNTNDITIENYLKAVREEAVRMVVENACQELPAYRQREPQELREAVSRSYDNWCESVFANNFTHSVANSKAAIKAALAQGLPTDQLAHTPWIIYEVVTELLLKASYSVDTDQGEFKLDPVEQAEFIERAKRLTIQMVMVGKFTLNQQVSPPHGEVK